MSDHQLEELEVSNSLLQDVPKLRERLKETGYLFFRGILDQNILLQIRRDILTLANEYGLVKEDTEIMEGIFSGSVHPEVQRFETSKLYRRILDLESFNSYSQSPIFSLLFSSLLNGELQEHRRRIGRLTIPQSYKNTTPAHQDYFYIRGSVDTYTSWIPCGDCPKELGGLAILEGSNHLGFLEHMPTSGTGGHGVPEESYASLGLRWLGTHFKTGDLLLFHSHTIHKALHNVSEDKMRVSIEYRFQRRGDKIDPSSMRLHMEGAFQE